MLRRIFVPEKDNMIGGRRKLLHNVYSSSSMIRIMLSWRMRWAGRVASWGEENACMILVENPEGKRPLGRIRHRLKDNIKMDLRDWIGSYGLDCPGSWEKLR
jgi:hypothetical protein